MATNTTNYGWTKPSYEDAADIEVINGTIDNIDAQLKTVETALNSKQTALSTAQLAAVNSGITSEDVAQIETNKNNISNIQTTVASYHKASGTDIYFSETEPTGTITEGSYWISTNATKIKSKNKYNIDNPTMQYDGYISNGDDLVRPSTTGSMCAIIPCVVGNTYTIGVTSRSLRICFTTGYPTGSETTALIPYRQNYETYDNHTHTITAPANAAYMVVNCYLSSIEVTDGKTTAEIFGTLMINDGETAETYAPYWT